MPYSPTTWVEGVTKLGPTNMNHIEDGIAAAIPKDLIDAKGDLIAGSAADTAVRVAVGANGRALVADSGVAAGVSWADLSTSLIPFTEVDAKGDLLAGDAADSVARLAAGVAGQILVPNTAEATGLKWVDGGMVKLYDSTLGAATASFDITAIAADYEFLKLALYLRGDTAAASTTALLRFNGDAAANYDRQSIAGSAAAAAVAEQFGQTSVTIAETMPANTATANVFGFVVLEIPGYAMTVNNKVFQALASTKIGVATTNLRAQQVAGFWRSSVAITQITILPGAGNWNTGSRAILWGIG